MNRHCRASGFTMLELLTTVSIAGVLAALALPSFRYVTVNNRMSSEDNALLGDMQYARVEAIKEGNSVAVCVASSATTCSTTSLNWSDGWLVFSNPLGDGVLPAGQAPLRYHPSLATSSSTDTFVSTVSVAIFNREGFASGLGGTTIFTLHNTPVTTAFSRCLSLAATGYLTTLTSGAPGCL